MFWLFANVLGGYKGFGQDRDKRYCCRTDVESSKSIRNLHTFFLDVL